MTHSIIESSPQQEKDLPGEVRPGKRSRPTLRNIRLVQPTPLSEGYIGLLYRQLSLPITWLMVQTSMTANQISLLWLMMGIIAVALLASGTYWLMVLGAVLLQLVAVLDRVDGEVARYNDAQSMLGVFLDLAGHIFVKLPLFIGVSLGVYRSRPDVSVILLGISGASFLMIGYSLPFYKAYIFQKNNIKNPEYRPVRKLLVKLLMKSENLWRTVGVFGLVLVGAVSNTLYYILLFYAIVTPFWAISVFVRLIREIDQQDAECSLKKRIKVAE